MQISTRMNPAGKDPAHQLADHLFRHEAGRIVSILTGIYGARRLQLAEDVVQEAMIRAMKSWPVGGIPENPGAWLLRAAKNLAIDQLRREKNFLDKEAAIITEIESSRTDESTDASDSGFADDPLRLMFVCCHPALPPEAQIAIALKTLCGFSPAEIARAFLISEAAVAKRLTRARQRIQTEGIPFSIPEGPELPGRLESVLKILYLLFNEGHKASHGEEIIRAELCDEAIRLGLLLAAHPAGNQPVTHALLALMFLTASRFPGRLDDEGSLLRLEEQDRSRWNAVKIRAGLRHFSLSGRGDQLSEYHFQAGIAACHSLAADDASTDWPRILMFYDQLEARHSSPVVTLNRAVAMAKVHGATAAIEELENSPDRDRLAAHHLYHAVLGDLFGQAGNPSAAASHFRQALDLAETKPERSHLSKRLEEFLNRAI
jgi:RNA polymerase sigma-70 factor (ECF subfamily)